MAYLNVQGTPLNRDVILQWGVVIAVTWLTLYVHLGCSTAIIANVSAAEWGKRASRQSLNSFSNNLVIVQSTFLSSVRPISCQIRDSQSQSILNISTHHCVQSMKLLNCNPKSTYNVTALSSKPIMLSNSMMVSMPIMLYMVSKPIMVSLVYLTHYHGILVHQEVQNHQVAQLHHGVQHSYHHSMHYALIIIQKLTSRIYVQFLRSKSAEQLTGRLCILWTIHARAHLKTSLWSLWRALLKEHHHDHIWRRNWGNRGFLGSCYMLLASPLITGDTGEICRFHRSRELSPVRFTLQTLN